MACAGGAISGGTVIVPPAVEWRRLLEKPSFPASFGGAAFPKALRGGAFGKAVFDRGHCGFSDAQASADRAERQPFGAGPFSIHPAGAHAPHWGRRVLRILASGGTL